MMIRLAGFCMFSFNSQQHYKKINTSSNIETDDKSTRSRSSNSSSTSESGKKRSVRVMVVVDLRVEAAAALQWALSHTLHSHLDSIILLLVITPSKQGGNYNRELVQKAYQLLCFMKNMCQTKRPGVRVEISVKEAGKEKGPTIVEEAKQQRATLLVLGGQRKRPIMLRLRKIWARKRNRERAVDYNYYCIHNANCMTIAVRRKSSKYGGGYLITTKRHKDFWLLA